MKMYRNKTAVTGIIHVVKTWYKVSKNKNENTLLCHLIWMSAKKKKTKIADIMPENYFYFAVNIFLIFIYYGFQLFKKC